MEKVERVAISLNVEFECDTDVYMHAVTSREGYHAPASCEDSTSTRSPALRTAAFSISTVLSSSEAAAPSYGSAATCASQSATAAC